MNSAGAGARKESGVAVLLSVGLFVLWTVVGLAVLNAGRFRGGVRKLLLAPTVGFATFAVATYMIVRLGYTVGQIAWPVGIAVLLAALVLLWRTRTSRVYALAVLKRYRPFGVVIVLAFGVTAWPLFRFGFDWVANGNDDMSNYCLGATGFQSHGFHHIPTLEELIRAEDLTQPLWFLYRDAETLSHTRCGTELTLALVASWTALTPQQVFMPVILAFNLALISATAGLVLICTRRRLPAVVAACLLMVSSQTTYGVVQQLIAQASGLALFCTSLAMVVSPFRRFSRLAILRRAAVCGLTFGGFVLFYPEVVPFLVGACVLLGVRDLWRRRPVRRHLWHAGAAIATMVILLPMYLYGVMVFMLGQSKQGTGSKTHTLEIFPFFMTPRGPALVCGLMPTYSDLPEPRHSASLVLGLVFLAAVLVIALREFRRSGRPFAAVVLVMAAAGTLLYIQNAAFGLFKLAMFAQPFLWATVAVWLVQRRRMWAVGVAALCVLTAAGLNARTQYWYVKQSTGHDSRVDLPVITQKRVMTDFHAQARPKLASGQVSRVLIASENNVLVKLLGAELHETPTTILTMSPFTRLLTPEDLAEAKPRRDSPGVRSRAALWLDPTTRTEPWVVDPDTKQPLHQFVHAPLDWRTEDPNRVLLVTGCGKLSVFNRYHYPESGPVLLCTPLSEVRNLAVFRDVTGARHYFTGMDYIEQVAFHRLEPDPCFRHRTMAGVGKALVVDVLNPSAPRVRVLLEYSSSFRPLSSPRTVSPAQVVGNSRVSFSALGDGSARLVSPPVEPQHIGPSNLLAIDFNTELVRSPNYLKKLETIWGAELPRDRRRLSGHVRNVSIISEEEYAAFKPPEQIANLSTDLTHPQLEYSGLYEDGWVNGAFKARLTQATPGNELVLRGSIPPFPGTENFRTDLTVLIDGQQLDKRTLSTGEFEVRVAAGPTTGPRWIECRFSDTRVLPAPDTRTASAYLTFIGFVAADPSLARPPECLTTFPAGLKHPRLNPVGIHADGWVGKQFKVCLTQPTTGDRAVIRGEIPQVPNTSEKFQTELTVFLDGTEVARKTLQAGEFEIRAPAGTNPGSRVIECRFSNDLALPPPDVRRAVAHLKFVGFEPTRVND